jgi:hypothetical protein
MPLKKGETVGQSLMESRRVLALAAPLFASALALGGCMGSPTYGTDKTANEQLISDVSGILSIGSKKKEPIAYKPRPELVKPAETAVLPPPQDNIATASNPQWPESPEQRLARIRAEADENSGNPNYDSPVVADIEGDTPKVRRHLADSYRTQESGLGSHDPTASPQAQREAFNKRLAENRQGNEARRKYLSEPPLTYRQPSEAAPVGDVGEDEYKKARRAKRAARKNGDWSWRDLIPGA